MSSRVLVRTVVVALAVGACGDEGGSASADTTAAADTAEPRPDAPTPWIFEDDAAPVTPTLDAAALTIALEAALEAALELDPAVVKELFDLLRPPPVIGGGDQVGCPFLLTQDYGTAKAFYWQGECTAEDGTAYSGYGYASWYDDFVADGGSVVDGFEYALAGRIEGADGTWLEGAGTVRAYDGGTADVDGFARGIDGTFRAGGPRAPDSPWLDGTRRPSLLVSGWIYRPTGGKSLTFAGGIGGLDFPGGVTAVALDDLLVRTRTAGAACQDEPGGGASVRGPDGSWYDVVFDGPTEEEPGATPPELCDGCGETWFRGAALAPTCVETAPLVSWEGRPW
ncbi:MAG: hypothetical protein IT385_20320 [Deltaproteobacteria bacterium]|nr:hypothetical protein [Deltaproteobacteria bacterium]